VKLFVCVCPLYFRTTPSSFVLLALCVYFAKINSRIFVCPQQFILVFASLHTRKLLQTIQYLARSKVVQAETRELASLTRGKIKPGEKDEWLNEQLYVPPLPPTNLRGCNLIRIQYDVYVRAQTPPALCSLFFSRLSSCVYTHSSAVGNIRQRYSSQYFSKAVFNFSLFHIGRL
jgi:Arrestin (or S-antigen), C-terminal domain